MLKAAVVWEIGGDGEMMYKSAFEDFPGWNSPTGLNNLTWEPYLELYRAVKGESRLRRLFADHVHKHFRNGGILSEAHLIPDSMNASKISASRFDRIPAGKYPFLVQR